MYVSFNASEIDLCLYQLMYQALIYVRVSINVLGIDLCVSFNVSIFDMYVLFNVSGTNLCLCIN